MFDSKQTLTERLGDAVDLMIDFATLGEYGLEPAAKAPSGCQVRRRPYSPRPLRSSTATRGAATRP
jgi:hypothetical protein